jgi:hypothetical protein
MRPLERVIRTRRALAATVAARALLGAAAVALGAGALAIVVTRRSALEMPGWAWVVTLGIAVAVLAALARPWSRLTVPRVALWIEERVPRLQYALVTAVDPVAAHGGGKLLDQQIAAVPWQMETRRALTRALAWPGAAALAGLVVFLAATRVDRAARTLVEAAAAPRITKDSRPPAAPFARLSATVRAPAYAGGRIVRSDSPGSIAALVGSTITLEAPGTGAGISVTIADQRATVERLSESWRIAFTLGDKPGLVRLRHSSGERIVALEPRPDSVPYVRLTLPARDTVMRVPRGTLALAADAHDDIGLATASFEYIVSSGEGESFQFRSGTLGARRVDGARDVALAASLSLEGLALKPGDLVHLRAVARDGNTVSGPGVGASETRVIRIARAGEYDSIAVEGAPPPEADKSLISQRMLIILAEALDKRRPTLARETLLSESRNIARDQTRLRKRVGDIIFARLGNEPTGEEGHGPDEPAADSAPSRADSLARDSTRRAAARAGRSQREIAAADSADSARAALLRAASAATGKGDEILDFEGDETPVVAINRPLLEAYNAMWEASRELDQGETGLALPPMRRALAAIQRARQAERIYLRGRAPSVVVDLSRVRLTGKETGGASTRVPRAPTDPAAARRAERVAAAIALAARAPSAAIDSMVLLRVESLDAAPRLATALADALDAMRSGRDATGLLARARRIADGGTRASGRLGAWSGVW